MKSLLALPFKVAPRSLLFYLVFWAIWFCVLWYLSSQGPTYTEPPLIPHQDKILHFGYFACGGGLVAGAVLNSNLKSKASWLIVFVAFLMGAAVGALDEYRQSKIEGRTGNDPWDWTADCLGSIAGAACMVYGWRKWKLVANCTPTDATEPQ